MAQTSLIIGDTNWAVKEDSLLGYNVIQNNYLPIPIDCVRATTATRVNEQGLIEIVPRNLVNYSEQLDNADWIKTNLTITSPVAIAPNGTLTADKLIPTTTNDLHIVEGSLVSFVSGNSYTFSFYAKRAEDNFIQITASSSLLSTRANFNLLNGTLGFVDSGITATITPINNDWYRCTASFVAATTGNFRMVLCNIPASTSARFATFAGNGTSGLFVWGAQIDNGSVATEYFPTTNRLDIPRIDYSTGTASLLVEPQRTNLYTYSQQLNQWSIIGGITVTENDAISPDGTQNADRAQFTASTDLLYRSGTGLAGSNTLTVYAKAKSGTSQKFRFFGNGGLSYSSDQVATNQWQRFTFTYTYSATTAGLAGATTGAGDVLFYGFQHEIGTYATSYIPTIASSVTRNTDVLGRTGISGLIGQTEGVIFLDCKIYPTDTKRLAISDGTTANAIYFQSDATNRVRFLISQNSATILDTGNFTLANPNAFNKIAFKYKSNDFAIWVNGSEIYSSTAVALSFPVALSKFAFDFSASGLYFFGEVKSTQLYKTALSNTELAQLTTL